MLELFKDKYDRNYLLKLILIVIVLKIIGLSFVYWYSKTDRTRQGVLHQKDEIVKRVGRLSIPDALGYRWDCIHYVNFAHEIKKGNFAHTYHVKNYGIIFPLLIALFSYITGSEITSAILISNLASLFAVLAFYCVCRRYFSREKSFAGGILLASFPAFFASGLVAYSDSLFLLLAVMAWYFFDNERYFLSALFTGLCLCTRTSGMIYACIFPLIILINVIRFSIPNRKLVMPSPWVFSYILPFIMFFAMTIITKKIRPEPGFHSDSFTGFLPVFNSDLIPVSTPIDQFKYLLLEPGRALGAYMYIIPALILVLYLKNIKLELMIYTMAAFIAIICISKKEVIWAISRHILNAWGIFVSMADMMENKWLKWVVASFFLMGGIKMLDTYFTHIFI